MNSQEDRIAQILADGDIDNEEMQEKSSETVIKYLHYLKDNIEFPCIVTGLEDFPWEEKYVFGSSSNKKEYERLKQDNPSYKDKFEILDFYEDEDYDEQIMVTVRRLNDKKKFILDLDNLKSIDKKSINYQLLDDYSVWYVNY